MATKRSMSAKKYASSPTFLKLYGRAQKPPRKTSRHKVFVKE